MSETTAVDEAEAGQPAVEVDATGPDQVAAEPGTADETGDETADETADGSEVDETVADETVAEETVAVETVAETVEETVEETVAEETVGRLDALALDDPDALRRAVESVLFVVDAPVGAEALAAALQRPVPEVETALAALRTELDERGSGLELREVAGGVRLYTRPEWSPAVEAFLLEGQRNTLSRASLETLAVIAYRQPVSRARVSAIRGVTVDGVVRTLLARGLLVEAGTDPDTGASLLATTDLFLERMGLQSLDGLPSLAPLLPDAASLSALDGADGLDVDDL